MEGPGEFAEGLSIGVRSVFSGVVGGAAGTVSKVSVLAKGKGCSIIHAGFVLYLQRLIINVLLLNVLTYFKS